MPTASALEGLLGFSRRPEAPSARRLHDKDIARLHQRFIAAGEFFNGSVYALDRITTPLSGLAAGQSIRLGQAVTA